MTEKNIFPYRLFVSLNISDYIYFFVKIVSLPKKSHHPLSQQTPEANHSLDVRLVPKNVSFTYNGMQMRDDHSCL